MCFSASASFLFSALLIPAGTYCVKTALFRHSEYLPLACLPLAFGIQQGFEGLLWLGLGSNHSTTIAIGSLGFLFFSHGFWPFWTPLSAFRLERNQKTRNVILLFVIAGLLYGISLYIPLFLNSQRLLVRENHGSIDYQIQLIFGPRVAGQFICLIYAFLVIFPLFISSNQYIKVFSGLLLFSIVVAYLAFNYAFISVWCFFAAALSLYIVYTMHKVEHLAMEDNVYNLSQSKFN